MKEIIIGFILYIIWDAYQRQKMEAKYLTKSEFLEYKNGVPNMSNGRVEIFDSGAIIARLEKLEKSPYA